MNVYVETHQNCEQDSKTCFAFLFTFQKPSFPISRSSLVSNNHQFYNAFPWYVVLRGVCSSYVN